MAAKKSARKKTAPPPPPNRARRAAQAVRETWNSALAALGEAEADLEQRVKELLAENRIDASDAGTLVQTVGAALDRGRRGALEELEGRLRAAQERVTRERQALRRAIAEGVQGALATFNIPSRREIAELTRKVDALARKVDTLRRAR